MPPTTGIRTRNELRYYKQRGKMPRLRIRGVPKSVKKQTNQIMRIAIQAIGKIGVDRLFRN